MKLLRHITPATIWLGMIAVAFTYGAWNSGALQELKQNFVVWPHSSEYPMKNPFEMKKRLKGYNE